jgi:hypothetical protein
MKMVYCALESIRLSISNLATNKKHPIFANTKISCIGVKFIYSEKASKFFEISTIDLTGTT